MGFKRIWDSSCPHDWSSWEADGVTWVVRDLRPEDDEEAIKILVDVLCADEVLCSLSGLLDEPESVRSITDFWRGYLAQRMSLGCYEEKDGTSKLVGLNVCLVICEGEDPDDLIEGKAWNNVYDVLKMCDEKVNAFKLLGLEKLLYGVGLVVCREYRGAQLGTKILEAREPLCLHYGIKGTSTVFTGPASQISAKRAGFDDAVTLTFKEIAEAGLDYPKDENRCVKLMVKKYE